MQAVLASRHPQSASLAWPTPMPVPAQTPVHLPSFIAPALANNNEGLSYLRWKAVIHYLPNAAAAAHSPDFAAAKWFMHQMSYKNKHGHACPDSGELRSSNAFDMHDCNLTCMSVQ